MHDVFWNHYIVAHLNNGISRIIYRLEYRECANDYGDDWNTEWRNETICYGRCQSVTRIQWEEYECTGEHLKRITLEDCYSLFGEEVSESMELLLSMNGLHADEVDKLTLYVDKEYMDPWERTYYDYHTYVFDDSATEKWNKLSAKDKAEAVEEFYEVIL